MKTAGRPVARGAERSREIFCAPHHAPQAWACALEVEQFEHGPCGLGRDDHDPGAPLFEAGCRLERVEIQGQVIDVSSPFAFWEDDTIGPARHHRGEVAKR